MAVRLLQFSSSTAMLKLMKNTILKSLLTALLLFTFTSHAGLYKGLDEDGNVVYSDTPFDNAEKITPPQIGRAHV